VSAVSLLISFGILGGLDSLTIVSSVDSSLSELLVDLGSLHFLGQRLNLASWSNLWKSEYTGGSVLGSRFNLLGGGVVDLTLLDLTSVEWEKDELGLIVGQSLHIGVLHILRLVVSSVVDGDSDSLGEGWGKFSQLELLKSEAFAELNLTLVFSSLSLNQWSQLGEWSWEDGLGFSGSVIGSYLLVGDLVEIAFNSSGPMLSQMRALKDIIVFYHVAY
jgi:hypothetical protein